MTSRGKEINSLKAKVDDDPLTEHKLMNSVALSKTVSAISGTFFDSLKLRKKNLNGVMSTGYSSNEAYLTSFGVIILIPCKKNVFDINFSEF